MLKQQLLSALDQVMADPHYLKHRATFSLIRQIVRDFVPDFADLPSLQRVLATFRQN